MRSYPIHDALLNELLRSVEAGEERRFNRIEQAHFAELVRRGLIEPMGNGDYNLTDAGFEKLPPGRAVQAAKVKAAKAKTATTMSAAETAADTEEHAPKRGLFKFNRNDDEDNANLPPDSENP